MNNSKQYDVIILGTGIGGTMLGAILAKHGLSAEWSSASKKGLTENSL